MVTTTIANHGTMLDNYHLLKAGQLEIHIFQKTKWSTISWFIIFDEQIGTSSNHFPLSNALSAFSLHHQTRSAARDLKHFLLESFRTRMLHAMFFSFFCKQNTWTQEFFRTVNSSIHLRSIFICIHLSFTLRCNCHGTPAFKGPAARGVSSCIMETWCRNWQPSQWGSGISGSLRSYVFSI